jgi:hypothetical protein
VEARHAAWIRSIRNGDPAPDAVDAPFGERRVMRELRTVGLDGIVASTGFVTGRPQSTGDREPRHVGETDPVIGRGRGAGDRMRKGGVIAAGVATGSGAGAAVVAIAAGAGEERDRPAPRAAPPAERPVGIGRERWPTPRGTFIVRNRLGRFSSPQYGPVAFDTSARSPTLTDWPAGGFVGIHGTDRPDLIPGRVSHGCVRLRNPDILRLARLMPVGTPVEIR